MIYVGITPLGGSFLLPPPVCVKLIKSEDAPAHGFTGVFPLIRDIDYVTYIRIYNKQHKLCFDGIVDEQKKSRDSAAKFTLNARSRAAVLLDNEAIPQTYCSPSLETVFLRHVKPYGFASCMGETSMFNGELIIAKGMSEWQAVEKFCRDYLKVKPRIKGNIFDATGKKPKGELVFDNSGGIGYSSILFKNSFYHIISEVVSKTEGTCLYTPAAKNKNAESLGIKRRRCLSGKKRNPDELIHNSESKAFCIAVECPGEIGAELFMRAKIRDTQFGIVDNLYVSQIEYKLSVNGEISRFILRRW